MRDCASQDALTNSDCSNVRSHRASRSHAFQLRVARLNPLVTLSPFISHNRNFHSPQSKFNLCLRHSSFFFKRSNDIFLVEVAMNAASDVSVRAIPETQTSFNPLMSLALLCALVLGTSFCLATFGLDISAGFF